MYLFVISDTRDTQYVCILAWWVEDENTILLKAFIQNPCDSLKAYCPQIYLSPESAHRKVSKGEFDIYNILLFPLEFSHSLNVHHD